MLSIAVKAFLQREMQHIIVMILLATLFHNQSAAAQRMERRTNVRAALANKLDPNFWPSRGRRNIASPYKHSLKSHIHPDADNIQLRQTSDEDGPFWANRGRSISDIDHILTVLKHEKGHGGAANRERAASEGDGPFWANRGRAIEEEGPFWANRGRSTDENGPFWANRGRALEGLASSEDGPFWANRGRRDEGERKEERWRKDTFFVEEPGYISFTTGNNEKSTDRRSLFSDKKEQNSDMFWVARGKKMNRLKRELRFFHPIQQNRYSNFRDRRDNKFGRALEQMKSTYFWPSRGKRFHNNFPFSTLANQTKKITKNGTKLTESKI